MIYGLMAGVLGFAAWQLIAFVKRAKAGMCAGGCGGCASRGNCSIQNGTLIQIEEK
jgi:hypothetical protein